MRLKQLLPQKRLTEFLPRLQRRFVARIPAWQKSAGADAQRAITGGWTSWQIIQRRYAPACGAGVARIEITSMMSVATFQYGIICR